MMQNCIKFRCKKAMPVPPRLSRFQAVFTRNYFHNPGKIQFYFIQFCIEKNPHARLTKVLRHLAAALCSFCVHSRAKARPDIRAD